MKVSNYPNPNNLTEYILALEKRIQDLERANPLNNGTVDEGDLIVKSGGRIAAYDGEAYAAMVSGQLEFQFNEIDTPGRMFAGLSGGRAALWIYPSRATGIVDPTYILLEGPSGDYAGGNLWIATEGLLSLRGDTVSIDATQNVNITAGEDVNISADDDIRLSPGADVVLAPTSGNFIQVYSLDVGSGVTPIGYRVSGGLPVLAIASSSEKIKDDLTPTNTGKTILDLQTFSWRDKKEVAENPDTDVWYVGTTYEEVIRVFGEGNEYAIPPQTITPPNEPPYETVGAVRYERLFVPLLDLAKEQNAEIQTLKQQMSEVLEKLALLSGDA